MVNYCCFYCYFDVPNFDVLFLLSLTGYTDQADFITYLSTKSVKSAREINLNLLEES